MSTGNSHEGVYADLHERIRMLTLQLQSEVVRVNSSHDMDLQTLGAECSKAMKELTGIFDIRFREIQVKHREQLSVIEEEIVYLRELASSQRVMLQDSIDYIKELEQRYVTKPPTQEKE